MNRNEQSLQTQICSWMKLQHPKVIFKVDHGASQHKSSFIERQIYSKQSYKPGFPDFQIIKAVGNYNGLFLELKSDYNALFNKNGTLKRGSEDHLVNQYDFIKELRSEGYWADFCYDRLAAVLIIDSYLKGTPKEMNEYTYNSLTIAEKKEIEMDEFFGKK